MACWHQIFGNSLTIREICACFPQQFKPPALKVLLDINFSLIDVMILAFILNNLDSIRFEQQHYGWVSWIL